MRHVMRYCAKLGDGDILRCYDSDRQPNVGAHPPCWYLLQAVGTLQHLGVCGVSAIAV